MRVSTTFARKAASAMLLTFTVASATAFLPLAAHAHDHGNGGGNKKIIVKIGPVTKTHDRRH